MSGSFVDLDAGVLAEWLEQPSEKMWTVDGEDVLAAAISFPCRGEDLAPLLRSLGIVRVFASAEVIAEYVRSGDVGVLAQDDGGEGVQFALAGPGEDQPRWLLIEDTFAESLASGM